MLELQKTQGRRADPLEEEMAIHSSIIARIIPWTQEPGRLSPWGRKESGMTEAPTCQKPHFWGLDVKIE